MESHTRIVVIVQRVSLEAKVWCVILVEDVRMSKQIHVCVCVWVWPELENKLNTIVYLPWNGGEKNTQEQNVCRQSEL